MTRSVLQKVAVEGPPYKGIIWNQKREKPVGLFCGQRYYWTKVLRIGLLAESIKRIDNWSKRIDSVTLVNPSHVLYCQSQFAVKANELTEGKSPLNFAMVIAAQGINGYLSVSAIT